MEARNMKTIIYCRSVATVIGDDEKKPIVSPMLIQHEDFWSSFKAPKS
jgi:hypothetical protein